MMIKVLTLDELSGMKAPAVDKAAAELMTALDSAHLPVVLKRMATKADSIKRYLTVAQRYKGTTPAKQEPAAGATAPPKVPGKKRGAPPKNGVAPVVRDPGERFLRKQFKLIYDPEHPKRVVLKEKVKGEEVAVTQAEAVHRFERMGRLILDRWAKAVADGKAKQIMTGREMIALLEHNRATHFPSCSGSLYRAFQNYMTVFGTRTEKTPKGLNLVEKLEPLDADEL